MTNDSDRAEKILKKVIELNPEHTLAHKDLGVIYLTKRLFDYAKDEFEKAYALSPDNPSILFEYGNYLHLTNDFQMADEIYTKALAINPQNPNILAFAALNNIQLKKLDKAKEQIDNAIKFANDQPFLLFIAGNVRFLMKEYDDAKTYLVKSYEKEKTDDCKNLLGLYNLKLDNYEQANLIFQNLLKKNPMNINILLNSAKCFEKLEDKTSALSMLEKAVEIFPDCEEAHELIRKLS